MFKKILGYTGMHHKTTDKAITGMLMEQTAIPYDVTARFLWHFFSPIFFPPLKEHCPAINIPVLRKASKKRYREILARTPSIGSTKENPLAMALTWGALVIAVYQSGGGKISEEALGKMVAAMGKNPLMRRMNKKDPFTRIFQDQKEAQAKASQEKENPYDWKSEFIPGDTLEEYGINYTRCGLCRLAQQEGCTNIVPQMCQFDFISADFMGAELTRTKTLAEGADCCDFRYRKKSAGTT